MKKVFKKLAVLAAVAALTLTCGLMLAACGGGEAVTAAKITAVYTSNDVSFMSAYPTYTYKQLTVSTQTLTLYDDGTYCLTQNDNMLSGALNFPDVATEDNAVSYTNRGNSSTSYFGTYTSTEEEGMMEVVLSKPTAVRFTSKINQMGHVNGFFDSENWTDEMAQAMGTKGDDGSVKPMTRDEFLAGKAFNEITASVDKASGGFDFLTLTVAKG